MNEKSIMKNVSHDYDDAAAGNKVGSSNALGAIR